MRKFFLLLFLPSLATATVHFGADLQYFCLKGEMREGQKSGLLKGAIFEIDYYTQNNWYIALRTQINTGDLSGRTYYGFKTHNYILDKTIEGKFGYEFANWTPYCGLSYYDLNDRWSESGTINRYQTLSLPIGVKIQSECISLILQVNAMLYGEWKINGHFVIPETSNRLQNRLFYLIETPISYWIKGINVKITPFFRYGTLSRDKICGIAFNPIHLRSIGGRFELGLAY